MWHSTRMGGPAGEGAPGAASEARLEVVAAAGLGVDGHGCAQGAQVFGQDGAEAVNGGLVGGGGFDFGQAAQQGHHLAGVGGKVGDFEGGHTQIIPACPQWAERVKDKFRRGFLGHSNKENHDEGTEKTFFKFFFFGSGGETA